MNNRQSRNIIYFSRKIIIIIILANLKNDLLNEYEKKKVFNIF